jgi:hypothetical protein
LAVRSSTNGTSNGRRPAKVVVADQRSTKFLARRFFSATVDEVIMFARSSPLYFFLVGDDDSFPPHGGALGSMLLFLFVFGSFSLAGTITSGFSITGVVSCVLFLGALWVALLIPRRLVVTADGLNTASIFHWKRQLAEPEGSRWAVGLVPWHAVRVTIKRNDRRDYRDAEFRALVYMPGRSTFEIYSSQSAYSLLIEGMCRFAPECVRK